MDVTGVGITGVIRVEIEPDFRPVTELALEWVQCSSGKWVATDRGAASDLYAASITVTGYEKTINDLIEGIYNNRIATTGTPNVLTLTNFASTELIFGEDVDHTSITATCTEVSNREQVAFHAWKVDLKLQAISPDFIGFDEPVVFTNIEYAYKGYNDPTITKYDSYTGAFTYADRRADSGVFEGTVYLTNAACRDLRRTVAINRGAAITTVVMSGIDELFGPTIANSWPRNLKYLEVKDLGYWGVNRHRMQIKAVEDI